MFRNGRRLASVLVLTTALTGAGPIGSAHADLAGQIRDGQVQLDRLNGQAELAAEAYNGGRLKLQAAQRVAATAQKAMSRADADVAKARLQVSAVAAAAYKSGAGGVALRLMTDSTPGAVIEQFGMLDHLSRTQAGALDRFATARHRQASAAFDARAALAQADATLRVLAKDKAAVVSAAAQAQQVLRVLQATEQQLVQAARDNAARRAAQAQAAALASQAQAAAVAAAAFSAQPIAPEASPSPTPPSHYSGPAAQVALRSADDQLGKPYEYGAAGPSSFDCSGLTMYAYAQAGISLPHHAADQYNQGRHISESELTPGDLVFFDNLGHVGIYAGSGQFIHAPHSGTTVQYGSMAGYWQQHYVGAVRLSG